MEQCLYVKSLIWLINFIYAPQLWNYDDSLFSENSGHGNWEALNEGKLNCVW
jgi:hypothetical protein